MNSAKLQTIPVFPVRPSQFSSYGRSNRWFPRMEQEYFNQQSFKERSKDNEGKRRIGIVILVVVLIILALVAIVVPIVLSQIRNKSEKIKIEELTTYQPSTSGAPATNSSNVHLTGNFTILERNLNETSADDVCSNLTSIITAGGQTAFNCNVLDIRHGSVRVQYEIDILKEPEQSDSSTLNRASTSLALAFSNGLIGKIDAYSITFDDLKKGGGALEQHCIREVSCPGDIAICISVVDGFVCVCKTGSSRSDYHTSGPCRLSDQNMSTYSLTPPMADSQTSTQHPNTSKSDFQTSSPQPQTLKPTSSDFQTSSPQPQTLKPTSSDFQTSSPQPQTLKPISSDFQTSSLQPQTLKPTSSDFQTSSSQPQTLKPTSSDFQTSSPQPQTLKPTSSDFQTSSPQPQTLKPTSSDFQTSSPQPQTLKPTSFRSSRFDSYSTTADFVTSMSDLRNTMSDSLSSSSVAQTSNFIEQTLWSVSKTSKTNLQTSVTVSDPEKASTSKVSSSCSVFCVPTQQCIPANQICDKTQDCPDDTDETNCTCDRNHYPCRNGRCIYRSWLCDGVKDCPLGDDESPPTCRSCNATQFLCSKPNTCISSILQCDGVSNCVDSSDESHCITTFAETTAFGSSNTSLVNATYRGVSGFYICSENWNLTWSDSVCKQMGYENSLATSYEIVYEGSFLVLNVSALSSNLMTYLQNGNCSSKEAVAISCSSSVCGTRSVPPETVGPYILNGQLAKRGAWPWFVLYLQGIYSSDFLSFTSIAWCGGTLINNRWILTAAHCNIAVSTSFGYSGQVKPENVRISLGLISRVEDSDTVNARVDKIFIHPEYNSTSNENDVGLLRLSDPIVASDTIRPICLPSATEDISKLRVCVNTGFGRTIRNVPSNDLLQARMNILSYTDCYNYIKNSYVKDRTQFCMGTVPTEADINICRGDSGGPLSCQDNFGIWKVLGINSFVIGANDNTALNTCVLSVANRVTYCLDWIEQTMAANVI